MNILITGGTGFIGHELCPFLLKDGHYLRMVTRHPQRYSEESAKNRQFISLDANLSESIEWADAVINLAGESIFSQRWTEDVKQAIYASRIDTTKKLAETIKQATEPPEVMISGSAIGYYGPRGDDILSEQEPPGDDFLANVCVDWEQAAASVKEAGVRLVVARTGIVLEKGGGMVEQMLPLFQYFVGGPIGPGHQYIPWIHRYDFCRVIYLFLTDEAAEGSYNVCAPHPETMGNFAQWLGDVLNRPSFFKVPEWALKIALGEAAEPVVESIRAKPDRLNQQGFDFTYAHLREALAEII